VLSLKEKYSSFFGESLKISTPSLTCANKGHPISDIPLNERDEKLR
jgi:hypothetical protein